MKNKRDIFVFLVALAMLMIVAPAQIVAQGEQQNVRPSLAVFVVGMESNEVGDFLAILTGNELAKNERYNVITKSEAVQDKLKKIREYEQNGNVNEGELVEWGRQNNLSMLCLITSIKLDEYVFTAQLTDVKTNTLIGSSYYSSAELGGTELKKIAEWTANELMESLTEWLTKLEKAQSRRKAEQSRSGAVQSQSNATQSQNDATQSQSDATQSQSDATQSQSDATQSQSDATQSQSDATQSQSDAESDDRNIDIVYNDNGRKNGDTYNPDGIELVYVAGSGGTLGVQGFYIGKYEITQAQYQKVMGNNPSGFQAPDNPVENVSWNDTQEFLTKLNAMTGRNYRLPTEIEWVYAAKSGPKDDVYEYAGGNNVRKVARFSNNSKDRTHPVGSRSPNSIGIYDMSGNVWEWCQDYYDIDSYDRVIRGGGWGSDAEYCRITTRDFNYPNNRGANLGFRVALIEN
jgi:formylglycine-generating enzyme required for sulfatase activity